MVMVTGVGVTGGLGYFGKGHCGTWVPQKTVLVNMVDVVRANEVTRFSVTVSQVTPTLMYKVTLVILTPIKLITLTPATQAQVALTQVTQTRYQFPSKN